MNMTPEFFGLHGLPDPVQEYAFHQTRKWRFDFAWPDLKIALEIEGGRYSGGRHTSPEGYHKDLEKYNEAACAGWRVLKITPQFVGTIVPIDLVKRAIATDTVSDKARLRERVEGIGNTAQVAYKYSNDTRCTAHLLSIMEQARAALEKEGKT